MARSALIEAHLLHGVVAREIYSFPSTDVLHPLEVACIARCTEKRSLEFAAGRLCARSALEALGLKGLPVLVNPDRSPAWPGDIVGSITHTTSYCAAAIAPRSKFRGIGIDAEFRSSVSPDLLRQVCTEEELAWLATLPAKDIEELATVIFSAKESVYKCQSGWTTSWLGFHDISLQIADGTFSVRFAKGIPNTWKMNGPPCGRFRFFDDLVITAIGHPASAMWPQ